MSQAAEIVAVCVGPGGIPKPQVETCAVTVEGLEGDGHRYESHGGARPGRLPSGARGLRSAP